MQPAPGVLREALVTARPAARPATGRPPDRPAPRPRGRHGHRSAARGSALRLGLLVAIFAATSALPAPQASAEALAAPTDAERATYWLDRLMLGPDGPSLGVPHYHQNLLMDAQQGLVDVRGASLDRLADPALRERVTANRDTNGWHAILGVLIQIGVDRPEVARAWAAPALQHPEVTLRRLAAGVFAALKAPEDLAVLLETLRRDATDRQIGPMLVKAMVGISAPAAAAAARLAYETMPVDGGEGSGTWNRLPGWLEDVHGGSPYDDVLAWWGLLTDGSGPRAPNPAGVRGGALPRIDPDGMVALAVAHVLTDARQATAETRALLAQRDRPTARAAIDADLVSPDPILRRSAARVAEARRRRAGTDREAVRARVTALLADPPALVKAGPLEVAALAEALRADDAPEATALQFRLLAAIPPRSLWKPALEASHDGLLIRGADPVPILSRWARGADEEAREMALHLIRRSRHDGYVDLLEALADDPAFAPLRFRLRRELAFRVVDAVKGGARFPPERLAGFAAKFRRWAEDPDDPSAGGLVSTLFDLGAPGQPELVRGLAGPRRGVFVSSLREAPIGRLDAAGMVALLAPVDADTPVAERAAVLQAAYFTARGSAVPALDGLRLRLPAEVRDDVDALLRMIRHRAP